MSSSSIGTFNSKGVLGEDEGKEMIFEVQDGRKLRTLLPWVFALEVEEEEKNKWLGEK